MYLHHTKKKLFILMLCKLLNFSSTKPFLQSIVLYKSYFILLTMKNTMLATNEVQLHKKKKYHNIVCQNIFLQYIFWRPERNYELLTNIWIYEIENYYCVVFFWRFILFIHRIKCNFPLWKFQNFNIYIV